MNIIITGGTGYLGYKIMNSFLYPGDKNNIMLLVRDKRKLPDIAKYQAVKIYEIFNNNLQVIIKEFDPDLIFSTTCCYETDPEYLCKTIDANYVFPARLLQAIIFFNTTKVIRFISISTSLPSDLNLYSLTKWQFSDIGKYFSRYKNIEFINILLESFYGLDEPKNRFISRSILLLKANKELLLTDGIQMRDYIYINDVIKVLYFIANRKVSYFKSMGIIDIPLGSGCAPSIKEIILFLSREIRSKSIIKFGAIPMRPNEPNTRADLSVLREIGYSGKIIAWREGMKKMTRGII
jgi:CDP-paratose synthetase